MVTTTALCESMDTVLVEKDLAAGCVRGLIVLAIHQKMLDLEMNDLARGARDPLVDS